jgi:ABC-2 type transport system permease protein
MTANAITIANGVRRRVRWEQRAYWRNPTAALFTFAFPLMFLFVFTTTNGNDPMRVGGVTVRFAQFFVPAIVGFGVISACYTNLSTTLVYRRQTGVLKRARATPVRPAVYLAGLVGNSIVIALLLAALTTAAGVVLYGVRFPGRWVALAIVIGAAAFCFSSLGVAVAGLVPNEDSAPAIVNFAIFPLLFLSGTFGNVAEGSTAARVSAFFPIRHLNALLFAVFDPIHKGAAHVVGRDLAIVLAWGLAALVVGIRTFRWEPRFTP